MSVGTGFDDILRSLDERIPTVEWPFGPELEVLALAGALLVGLAGVVPAFAVVVGALGLPIPLPLLVGLAGVGAVWTCLVVLSRRFVAGSLVALVVLGTFKANVPVIPAAHQFPKDVVGDLLVVHLPLTVLAGTVITFGWYRYGSWPGILLGGFVASTAVPWIAGWAPSTLAAASFTLFVALGLVSFLASAGAVADGYVAFRTLVLTAVLTIGTHAAIAVVQFCNQDPLGFTRLGEGGARRRVVMTLPAIGEATIGPYVSGFTGMSFVLSYLVVLVVPAAVLFVARRRGERRLLGGVGLLLLVGVVRASASDAARGGLVVAILAFAALLTVGYRRRVLDGLRYLSNCRPATLRRVGFLAAVTLPALVLLGYPSSVSGESVGAGEGKSGGAGGPVDAPANREIAIPGVDLQQVSIPLFNLSNFGVRLRQYVAAVDVFRRHPAFGLGGTNWVLVAGEYGFEVPWNMPFPTPIHSVYFTLLAETGGVGLGLYLGSLAAVFLVGKRLLVHNGFDGWRYVFDEGVDRAMVAAVLAGLIGGLTYSVFGVIHLYAAAGLLPFWALAGALVGEYRRAAAERTDGKWTID